jgi:phosphopantothenoylcysteine decarboxylase/phosphopantothenate--cysteine ligase
MRVLLGVTAGIAAYKVAVVLRRLVEDGHSVRVVPTPASLHFVGRATWEALSGQPATSDVFSNVAGVEHIRLGQSADLVLVAPATADFLAQMAHGEARDLLGNVLLATRAPVLVAPAMHTEMWNNPATRANIATLKSRGVHVIEPAVGRLTGPDSGPGRLPEPEEIVAAAYSVAAGEGVSVDGARDARWEDLAGLKFVISAGGTREPLDPVRFIGNRSTGHQGFALAQAAAERGATVKLVAANVELPAGEGIDRVDVETSAELSQEVRAAAKAADVVIMAAAVADFRPAAVSPTKFKKHRDSLTIELVQNEDILAGLVASRAEGQTIVGFAAETGDAEGSVAEYGAAKAMRKGADLLALNAVGPGLGFGDVANAVTLLNGAGEAVASLAGSKLAVAHGILDAIVDVRSRGGDVGQQG